MVLRIFGSSSAIKNALAAEQWVILCVAHIIRTEHYFGPGGYIAQCMTDCFYMCGDLVEAFAHSVVADVLLYEGLGFGDDIV